MRIGFIGLGIMGKPMAKNLLKAGHELTVFDLKAAPCNELAAAGAVVALSAKEVSAGNELVITMLPNSPEVTAVILGPDGIIESLEAGVVVVDMSSIAPQVSKEVAAALAAKGVAFMDAPVSGGEPKAIDGTLAIMVGGDAKLFERLKPVLLAMGSSAVLCGPVGAGNVTKLANQVVVALNIAAMSEAYSLAAKAGVDPRLVFEAIKGGLAGSTVLNAKTPMVLEGRYQAGFRLELHIKDLQNALDTGHAVGAPLPLTSQVMEFMQALKVQGKGQDDHSALICFYENLAKLQIRDQSL